MISSRSELGIYACLETCTQRSVNRHAMMYVSRQTFVFYSDCNGTLELCPLFGNATHSYIERALFPTTKIGMIINYLCGTINRFSLYNELGKLVEVNDWN